MNDAGILQLVNLTYIRPSPTNPRKTFNQAKLDELAASIREKGVIEPLVVRPLEDGFFELVVGERRYRASAMAEQEAVPCLVRDLNSTEVLELQVIENHQREDVHPLEEAEGFARLAKVEGYNVDRIAQKIGLSRKYVYDRLKLLDLVPEAQEVFLAGEINASHAILLARLSPADQKRAMGKKGDTYRSGLFTHEHTVGELELDLDDLPPDGRGRKAKSVREFGSWIRTHVRFRPEELDLPELFPDTAAALEAAAEQKLKVVDITYDYRVDDQARDPKLRTYGVQTWKRADGQGTRRTPWSAKTKSSKKCDHSVMGVVVAGYGRGDAFLVCVAKKKCDVHWKAEREEAEKKRAAKASGKKPAKEKRPSWEIRQEQERAERARWTAAAAEIIEAASEAMKTADALELFEAIVEPDLLGGRIHEITEKVFPSPATLEERMRRLAFEQLVHELTDSHWLDAERVTEDLKRLGIDGPAIVDRISPKPEPKKKAKKKPGARARRRSKKKGAS